VPIQWPFRPRPDSSRADLWTKCPSCEEAIYNKQLQANLRVCPKCDHHFRLRVDMRLSILLDVDSFEEQDAGLESLDPLGFVDLKAYPDRVTQQKEKTGIRDAAVWGYGAIDGHRVSIAAMDFAYMGGSMGSVVGEKITRAAEAALQERIPYIAISTSGGARMQEGTLALMQLVKTCAAVERLARAGVPYVSILSDPTTGGVFASFSALGDVNIAEPNALIGFAGARVAAGTTGDELPEGFQRSEFLFKHGFVDLVVERGELRDEVSRLLRYLQPRAERHHDGNGSAVPANGRAGADAEAIRG
jgi:acetyl-CoA carboxylase carboxyl transferase subunit beta